MGFVRTGLVASTLSLRTHSRSLLKALRFSILKAFLTRYCMYGDKEKVPRVITTGETKQ